MLLRNKNRINQLPSNTRLLRSPVPPYFPPTHKSFHPQLQSCTISLGGRGCGERNIISSAAFYSQAAPLIRPVGHLLPRFRGRRDVVESLKTGKSFSAARRTETNQLLYAYLSLASFAAQPVGCVKRSVTHQQKVAMVCFAPLHTPYLLVHSGKLSQDNLSLIHISEPTRPY